MKKFIALWQFLTLLIGCGKSSDELVGVKGQKWNPENLMG
jgi:hypothetical protein